MLDRCILRKEAYDYIVQRLSNLPTSSEQNWQQCIELDELWQLKEGTVDPSMALVTTLQDLFKGIIKDSEIEEHLVAPFKRYEIYYCIKMKEAPCPDVMISIR